MALMKALLPTSLREQAVQAIRASILANELEAGQIYSATVLAQRLGVSPTPVREAMLDLANGGLVEPVRNRGFRILMPDERDLDEISELRLMLEPAAMRSVCESATDEQLAEMESVVAEIEDRADAADVAGFLVADREFHLGLLEILGNRRLVRLVAQLRDQTRLTGISELAREGNLTASAREHREILAALRSRDSDAAEQLMRKHLVHTRGIWAGRSE
jgi:DNA-binding GntR family transcriptional regulator